jgi:hypothetical protein
LKVVNQYSDDILVYLDAPLARKNEKITTDGSNSFAGWNGPTKTMRGKEGRLSGNDAWSTRITIAPND